MDDRWTARVSPRPPAIDPYAPPQAAITPGVVEDPDSAEATRRELIKHEASIKSLGFLYLFSAAFLALGAVVFFILSLQNTEFEVPGVTLGVVYGAVASLSFYLGRGLRRLEPQVRVGVTILSVIGLIGFPIGTLINAYILYLLHCEKGRRVMTAQYQAIVAQTPHVRYRTPPWLILLALLLLAGLVAWILFAVSA